jgi:hypothetical protein
VLGSEEYFVEEIDEQYAEFEVSEGQPISDAAETVSAAEGDQKLDMLIPNPKPSVAFAPDLDVTTATVGPEPDPKKESIMPDITESKPDNNSQPKRKSNAPSDGSKKQPRPSKKPS